MTESTVPTHLGIILDGNRRWAKEHRLASFQGYQTGLKVFQKISQAAFERGVRYVSAYVWSTENWQRTEEEVGYVMNLVVKAADQYLDRIHKEGIKVVILGRRDGIRDSVLKVIKKVEEKTRNNTKGTLALCFNYGGTQEIIDATKRLITENVTPADLTQDVFEKALYYPEVPPLDLIIRTSGEQRISNFMLWRAAYAELAFVKKHWPDFTIDDLDACLADYTTRHRRIGV